MDLESVKMIIAVWAASQPLVMKAWIFGSRVRGTARADSDVDVAIEIRALPGDTEPLTTYIFEADELKRSIQTQLPFEVDLQWYGGPAETPIVHAGLYESSILAYAAHEVRLAGK